MESPGRRSRRLAGLPSGADSTLGLSRLSRVCVSGVEYAKNADEFEPTVTPTKGTMLQPPPSSVPPRTTPEASKPSLGSSNPLARFMRSCWHLFSPSKFRIHRLWGIVYLVQFGAACALEVPTTQPPATVTVNF